MKKIVAFWLLAAVLLAACLYGATVAGYLDLTVASSPPANPNASHYRLYANGGMLGCKTSTGDSCLPEGGATVSGTSPVVVSEGGAISISGVTALQGNGSKLQLFAGIATSGNCTQFDVNGNVSDAGAPCGGGAAFLSGTADPGVPAEPTILQKKIVVTGIGLGNALGVAADYNVTAGSAVVVVARCDNGTVGSITDSLGTTYSAITALANARAFIGAFGSSGPDTITFHADPFCGYASIGFSEVAGSNAVVDAFTQSTSSSGPPAVTTTTYNDLIILGQAGQYTNEWTATPPSVIDASGGAGGAGQQTGFIGHLPAGAPGTYTPSVTTSSAGNNNNFTIALRPTPVTSPGVDGNFYLNRTTGILWRKTGSSWVSSGWKLTAE